jgi:hypothetical protein
MGCSNDAHLFHAREVRPGDGQLLCAEASGPSVEGRPIGLDVVLHSVLHCRRGEGGLSKVREFGEQPKVLVAFGERVGQPAVDRLPLPTGEGSESL